MVQTTPDIEQIVSDYNDLWGGNPDRVDVVSESFSFYSPTDEIHGRDALEEYLDEMRTAFPDVEVAMDEMLASDEVVMMEFTWRGTHEGEFDDVPPTGNEVEVSGMAILGLADGQIQEDRTYFDSQEYFTQLGVPAE